MNSFYSLLSGSTQYSKKGKPVVCFCCYHKDEYYTYLLDSFYLALNWKRCSNNKHETRGVKSTKTHYRKLPVAYLHTQRSGDCNGKRSLITRSLQQQLRPTGVYRVNDDDVHPLGAWARRDRVRNGSRARGDSELRRGPGRHIDRPEVVRTDRAPAGGSHPALCDTSPYPV